MSKFKSPLTMKKNTKSNLITYALLFAIFIVAQSLSAADAMSSLMQGLLVPICVYVIAAVSLNLTVGILGELSLGHAGFMCVGAFASAFFSVATAETITAEWLRFLLALIIGGLVAVTLAFGEIIKNVMNVLYVGIDSHGLHFSTENSMALGLEPDGKVIINGALGITGTPKDSNFIIGFILVLLTVFVVLNLVNSRAGRAIMAIRDNRIAAESIGINVTKYKLYAFMISAFFAGIAGVLYAHNLSSLTATTNNFGYNMSITILVFVVLGGIGNIRGSVIAAVILTLLPEVLRSLNDYRMLIYSIVLILMMLFSSSPQMIALREKYNPKKLFSKKKKEAVE